MKTAKEFRLLYCNIDDQELAKKIAKNLIRNKLAACCSISSKVISIYNWNNKQEEDDEFTIMIKTHISKLDEIEKLIKNHHSYDVPEIISVRLTESNKDYLNWMKKEMDLK